MELGLRDVVIVAARHVEKARSLVRILSAGRRSI